MDLAAYLEHILTNLQHEFMQKLTLKDSKQCSEKKNVLDCIPFQMCTINDGSPVPFSLTVLNSAKIAQVKQLGVAHVFLCSTSSYNIFTKSEQFNSIWGKKGMGSNPHRN